MWSLILGDLRLLDYLCGEQVFRTRGVDRRFAQAGRQRLAGPVLLSDGPQDLGQAHIRQAYERVRVRGGEASLLLPSARLRLSRPLYTGAGPLCIRGDAGGGTIIRGSISVGLPPGGRRTPLRPACQIEDCQVEGAFRAGPLHSREILRVGLRILAGSQLVLRRVRVCGVRGHGIFTAKDSILNAEECLLSKNHQCNVIVGRGALVALHQCTFEGAKLDVECLGGYLFMEGCIFRRPGLILERPGSTVVR